MRRRDFSKNERASLDEITRIDFPVMFRTPASSIIVAHEHWLSGEVGYRHESQFGGPAHG
jgi:hypothetical protein